MKIRRIKADDQALQQFLAAGADRLRDYEEQVRAIAREVEKRGDEAVLEYTGRFDGPVNEGSLRVSRAEFAEAYALVDDEFLRAIRKAAENIRAFHNHQLKNAWIQPDERGNILGQLHRPLQRAGIYVPGGTAAYPSSVLMNAIPAQVAGVPQIAMVSPPDKNGKINPYTLAAAAELGLEEIYKMGGAQAIFALARGTGQVKKVDLISGPGNIYVTLAKKMVYGSVNIDMLAGPSEILIIADKNADPVYLAADLMSQAEHDVLARSILVTPDNALPDLVEAELKRQVEALSRRDMIREALARNGAFIQTRDLEEACRVANMIAPEHLELMVEAPFDLVSQIYNAGAIFMGKYTPEAVGDYFAGPNHILPTGGTARFYSPVTVDTFTKSSSLIYYSRRGIEEDADYIIKLANVEGLTAHANSVWVRKGSD